MWEIMPVRGRKSSEEEYIPKADVKNKQKCVYARSVFTQESLSILGSFSG